MEFYTTQSVLDGAPIAVLHKKENSWIVLPEDVLSVDMHTVGLDQLALLPYTEAALLAVLPELAGKLDQKDETTININGDTGAVSVNPKHFHIGIPTHGAKATRQVNGSFSLPYYLMNTWSTHRSALIWLVVLFALGYFVGWFFYLPFAAYAIYKFLEIAKIRDMYGSGSLNPAIVIDAESSKIVSFTNMSMFGGDFPLIRVRKYPIPAKYRVNGARIPVAGIYQNTEDYPHWNYYEPIPLPTGIKNDDFIEERITSIPAAEWHRLEKEIELFGEIPKEGYYPITVETSDWKEVNLDTIEWMQFGEEK